MSGLGLTFLRRGNLAHPTAGSNYILSANKGDAEVFRILMDNGVSSDGVGITKEDAEKVTSLKTWFRGTNIVSFTELRYFINVTILNAYAFADCALLETIDLANVTAIQGSVFQNCSRLKNVLLGSTPSTLGSGVFSNATGRLFFAPADAIGNYLAASQWSSYKTMIFTLDQYESGEFEQVIDFASSVVKSIAVTNYDRDGDGELTRGEAAVVTNIGSLFSGLDAVSFDELRYFLSLTRLNDKAFSGSSFESMIIPKNVASTGYKIFTDPNCTKLKRLVVLNENAVVSVTSNALTGLTSIEVIYVPDALVESYKVANYWSNFASKIKPISEYAE